VEHTTLGEECVRLSLWRRAISTFDTRFLGFILQFPEEDALSRNAQRPRNISAKTDAPHRTRETRAYPDGVIYSIEYRRHRPHATRITQYENSARRPVRAPPHEAA
jgi:hypothetical protein